MLHPGYLEYVAVKRFDNAGEVIVEDRFLGLFTSTDYSANPAEIPLLRRKVADVVAFPANRLVSITNSVTGAERRFYRLVTPNVP